MKWLKLSVVILLVILSFYIFQNVSYDQLQALVQSYGLFAPLVYILLFTVLPIFLFPVPILAVLAGVCFGVVYGSIYTIIGAMLNSIIMYYIALFLGYDTVVKLFANLKQDKLKIFNDGRNEFILVLILRLIPFIPYNGLNYACGLYKIRFMNYVTATFVGIVPATIILIFLGDSSKNVGSTSFWVSIGLTVLLFTIPTLLLKKIKPNNGNIDNNSST